MVKMRGLVARSLTGASTPGPGFISVEKEARIPRGTNLSLDYPKAHLYARMVKLSSRSDAVFRAKP
jgi:hypothetical protein